jgi:hypothetical protein
MGKLDPPTCAGQKPIVLVSVRLLQQLAVIVLVAGGVMPAQGLSIIKGDSSFRLSKVQGISLKVAI